jgi:hypothetical protein
MPPAVRSARRGVSFLTPALAPSWVALGKDETLVLTAAGAPGDRLIASLDGRIIARSLPLDGAQGSLSVDPSALAARGGFARLELHREPPDRPGVSLGVLVLVDRRARDLARVLTALTVCAPVALALLSALPAAALGAMDARRRALDVLICCAPIALGLRWWSGRVRWILPLHAPSALLALLCAWTVGLAIRAERIVVHNLTGAPQGRGSILPGASAWTRARLTRILPERPCAPLGPPCFAADPRVFVPPACGGVPPSDALASLDHRVRYLGCPDRYAVIPASVLGDRTACAPNAPGPDCCIDLRGPRCGDPRTVRLEVPWRPERPAAPRSGGDRPCPARTLTPWSVTITGARELSEQVARVRAVRPGRELCVDLERWGAAHEIIMEDGPVVWRAARPRTERPSVMRVILPDLRSIGRPSLRVASVVREDDRPPIERTEVVPSIEGGWLRPASVRFTAPSRAGGRAALAEVTLGPRAVDRDPRWELVVEDGQPALHAEVWPGMRCGDTLHVRDPRGPLGRVLLPCPAPGTREDAELPWVLWRFSLRPTMPAPWSLAASTIRARPDAREALFDAQGPPRDVFVAFRGWDGVSVDLRLYTAEPRTLGITPAGEGRYELFAGPPPPRPAVCCQLDGIWSPCPSEFNDYWRCQGTVSGRPGCAEAYARCTFIDWVAERAAGRAPPRRR